MPLASKPPSSNSGSKTKPALSKKNQKQTLVPGYRLPERVRFVRVTRNSSLKSTCRVLSPKTFQNALLCKQFSTDLTFTEVYRSYMVDLHGGKSASRSSRGSFLGMSKLGVMLHPTLRTSFYFTCTIFCQSVRWLGAFLAYEKRNRKYGQMLTRAFPLCSPSANMASHILRNKNSKWI